MNLSDVVRGAVKEHLGGMYLPAAHDPLVQRIVHALGPRIRAAVEKGSKDLPGDQPTEIIAYMNNRITTAAGEVLRLNQPESDKSLLDLTAYLSTGIASGWVHQILAVRDLLPPEEHMKTCQKTLAEVYQALSK